MQIIKRNGVKVQFDTSKISAAIEKAMAETDKGVDSNLSKLIASDTQSYYKGIDKIPTVEEISDMTEELLAVGGRFDAAKRYILYRAERKEARNKMWDMDELQRDIYDNKYRHKGETFEQFINRVSGGNPEVGKVVRDQDFIFAGRILAGRGLERNVTLSNCYVLQQPQDNLESIFDVAKESARTYSYGGGCGFDLSLLRPAGAKVNNSALTTSGPVSFMELYSMTTEIIGQRGRRGALMLSMDVNHPDIIDFINVKNDLDKVTSANISVRTDDNFFQEFEKGNKDVDKIMNELAKSNWQSGEPGMLYWDRVQQWHLLSEHPEYLLTSTNPCGEQPLPAGGSCLLGSLNLSNFVLDPFTDKARVDWEKLEKVSRISVRGMNEVLDEGIMLHPLKTQQDTAKKFRQVGIGILGLSDLFIKMGVAYGSQESIELSDELGKFIRDMTYQESVELAKIDGPYPAFDAEIVSKSPYFKSLDKGLQDDILEFGMRNSHVLSIAPTGSISTMIGASGGSEPIFANSYTRTTKSLATEGDVDYKVYTKVIRNLMNSKQITKESELPEYAITSHDIKPFDRIKVQATWQKYVDSAISSTINLNEDATIEDIKDIYVESWKQGLKGVTVFRNNCWRTGILNTEKEETIDTQTEEECST